jgi:hypothetical protein
MNNGCPTARVVPSPKPPCGNLWRTVVRTTMSRIAILVGCLLGTSSIIAAEIAEQPTWEMGETWTYSRTSYATALTHRTEKSTYTMTVIAKTLEYYILDYSSLDADGQTTKAKLYWSMATNFVNWRGNGGKRQEFHWYKWPLEEGQAWQTTWYAPAVGDAPWTAKVRGWETITVPAGTFRALRIDLESSCYYNGVDGGVCGQEDVVWYSPTVKAKVRLDRRTNKGAYQGVNILEELVAYTVRSLMLISGELYEPS